MCFIKYTLYRKMYIRKTLLKHTLITKKITRNYEGMIRYHHKLFKYYILYTSTYLQYLKVNR